MKALLQSLKTKGRTLSLAAVSVPLLVIFAFVVLRSGPLAPIAVTVTKVQSMSLTPKLFGIGTVSARYSHSVGPTVAGRLASIEVDVGDLVRVGQRIGQMDEVDLGDRIAAQDAAIERTQASLSEAQARLDFALTQAKRYEELFAVKSTSQEILATKQQELRLNQAAFNVMGRELARIEAERQGLNAQRLNLVLISPVNGLVVRRDVEPGTTVVAGQTVIQIIDPNSLWINTRFDQINATGLVQGQPAEIVLRSRRGQILTGQVSRLEPLADTVTEELLAKISFSQLPNPLPPIGELAEVTVELKSHPATLTIPNAAIRRDRNQAIVWKVEKGALKSTPVKRGIRDLDGNVQVLEGLKEGDEIVVYSDGELKGQSSIRVVSQIDGVKQ